MAYKLLGMVVWRLGTLMLRRKYGPAMVPRPLLAGGALALVVAGVLTARARTGDDA
jgi:hypothetical protein